MVEYGLLRVYEGERWVNVVKYGLPREDEGERSRTLIIKGR